MPVSRRSKVLAFALLLAAACVLAVGRDRIWEIFGPADLGPVDFATLIRRSTPNDALVCAPAFCPRLADVDSPIFAVPVTELRSAFDKVLTSEPRITRVAVDDQALTARYVQRSAVMHFPDTIDVRFAGLSDGRSTILLYSRSQLGGSDFGVNRARLLRWLDKLKAQLPSR